MKKLTLTLSLIFTVSLSSPSYAEWTKVGENKIGVPLYVDFERIRKHKGYVYFWYLFGKYKPSPFPFSSSKIYAQGDCKLFRYKALSISHHKEPMGRGIDVTDNPKNPEWVYIPPNVAIETILNAVCNH